MIGESVGWAAAWLGWLLLISIAAWPLAARLFPASASRGMALSPALGWLLVSYLAWLGASLHLVPFGRGAAIGAIIVVAALSALSLMVEGRGTARWIRRNLALAVGVVAVLVVAFGMFAWVRGYAPDVRSTEKPMELGFLTSTMRTRFMPPADPWWSGAGINYYYFGYVEAATLGLLTDVRPETAFNLTGITLFALTFVGACGVVFDLLGRWRHERRRRAATNRLILPALLGGVLVALAGNAYGFLAVLGQLQPQIGRVWWFGVGWASSRRITDQINTQVKAELITEFPMFSFLLGDNHPHVLALPTVLLAVAVAFAWWWRPFTSFRRDWVRLALTALVIGVLYPLNAWDVPVYSALIALTFLVRRPARLRQTLVAFGATLIGAVVLFSPYLAHYKAPIGDYGNDPEIVRRIAKIPLLAQVIHTFGVVIWPHTSLGGFLQVFGVPFAAATCVVARGLIGNPRVLSTSERRQLLVAGIAATLVALVTRTPVMLPAGALVLAAVIVAQRPIVRHVEAGSPWRVWTGTDRLATYVIIIGASLPIITEFVYLRDAFENRMNTVFKVDYQAWVLLMTTGAYGIVTLLAAIRRAGVTWSPRLRPQRLMATVLGVCVFALFAGTYPLLATIERTGTFGRTGEFGEQTHPGWRGLDGFAYAERNNVDELAAVDWLRIHATTGDTLVEATGRAYSETAGWFDDRISASTGVPTVLGWAGHEGQWRGADPQIRVVGLPMRENDVKTLYETTNTQAASTVLKRYNIRWVIVGDQERVRYGGCPPNGGSCQPVPTPGFAKFKDMLPLAFQQGTIAIYRVPDSA